MKDAKFIELLNLYVDQQIDPADAALLEEEIMRNPARRRTYRQYCQMHRACTLVLDQSAPQSAVGEKLAAAAAAADAQILDFPGRRPSYARGILYFGGLAAAAAAVAFVFLSPRGQHRTAAPAGEQVVQITPAPANTAPAPDYQPVLVAHTLRLNSAVPGTGLAGATTARPSLDWMTQVQLAPLPRALSSEDFSFETPVTLRNDQNIFRSRLPVQGTAEKAAYQFQR